MLQRNVSMAEIGGTLNSILMTKIEASPRVLLWLVFILCVGLGLEFFLPTLFSYFLYKRINLRLESCLQEIKNAKEIDRVHTIISGYGLTLQEKETKGNDTLETFDLPMYFLDSESGEGFYFVISYTGDFLDIEPVWNIHGESIKTDAFSKGAKALRQGMRGRQFYNVLFFLIVYIIAGFFLFILIPRISQLTRQKRSIVYRISIPIGISLLFLLAILGLVIGVIVLLYTADISLINLPDQISFLRI